MEQEDHQKKMQSSCQDDQKSKKPVEMPYELLPPKEFVCRNSVLTDLWETTHHGATYNFGLSVMILLYICAVCLYCIDSDSLISHLSIVAWTFSKLHICALVWFAALGSILWILYPTFRLWTTSRFLSPKVGPYDLLFLAMFIGFQFALLILPAIIIIQYDVPLVSSIILSMEQVRLMMKCHSFVRENAEKVLTYKPHQDGGEKNDIKRSPDRGKLLYFLFAPTLLYKDSYPRTPSIRWNVVTIYFLQALGCAVVCTVLFLAFILDNFKNISKGSLPLEIRIRALKISTLASGFIMFYVFYGYFHCWMNAFAELLTFGDRRFYQEWWKSPTHARFYRYWNSIVHEWLHAYVYRETFHVCKNRFFALMMTFLWSGLFHGYVLGVSFRFAFPLYLIQFTLISGSFTYFLRKRTSNVWSIFTLTTWLISWTVSVNFYCTEWHARKNCPIVLDPFLDIFVPRLLTCN